MRAASMAGDLGKQLLFVGGEIAKGDWLRQIFIPGTSIGCRYPKE
jgi:hypothetical protein